MAKQLTVGEAIEIELPAHLKNPPAVTSSQPDRVVVSILNYGEKIGVEAVAVTPEQSPAVITVGEFNPETLLRVNVVPRREPVQPEDVIIETKTEETAASE